MRLIHPTLPADQVPYECDPDTYELVWKPRGWEPAPEPPTETPDTDSPDTAPAEQPTPDTPTTPRTSKKEISS